MRRGLALLLACAFAAPASAGSLDVRAPGASYSLKVTSLKEARFRTTVPQRYDFSCGSAATATLLTWHFGHPVTEGEVFKAILEGEMNATMAFMSGKLKVDGSMGLAMKLGQVLS